MAVCCRVDSISDPPLAGVPSDSQGHLLTEHFRKLPTKKHYADYYEIIKVWWWAPQLLKIGWQPLMYSTVPKEPICLKEIDENIVMGRYEMFDSFDVS